MSILRPLKKSYSSHSWPWVILLFLLWGTTWPIGKIAIEYFNPELLVCLRFSIAGTILFLYVIFSGREHKITCRIFLVAFGMGIFQYSLYYVFSYHALQSINASEAAVIGSSYPLFVILSTNEFWNEKRLIIFRIVGFLLGLSGVALSVGFIPIINSYSIGLGGYQMFIATISLAIGSRLLKLINKDDDVFFVTAIGMIVSGILVGSIIPFQDKLIFPSSWIAWLLLAYLVIIGSICVFLMWNKLIIENPLVEIASYNFLLPLFAIVSSFIILHERIYFTLIIGSSLIIIGIFITSICKVKDRKI